MTRPYPGVPESLRRLKDAGLKLGLLSNKADAMVQLLCETYLPGLLDAAAGERAGVPRKPDPTSLLEMVRRFGVKPEETVYVGDSEVDAATARNAGIRLVAVDWGFRTRAQLRAAGAECIVSDLSALERELLC